METPSTEPTVDQQKLAGIADRLEACVVEIVQRARDIQGQPREAPVLSTLLLLRGLSHYQALLVLAAEGFGIEMRMVVRSLLEVALCIAYLHNDPEAFAAELEADGTATQVQQAKVLMKDTQLFGNLSPESRRQLNDFIKSAAEAKPQLLNIGALAPKSALPGLYLPYRVASADAAHVSAISLARHFERDAAGRLGHFQLGRHATPEIFATLDLAIRVFMGVCLAHTIIVKDAEGNTALAHFTKALETLPPQAII